MKTAFQTGCVPDAWGACFVSTIFKTGDSSSLDNSRGIAVGSVFGRLFGLVAAWVLGCMGRGMWVVCMGAV